MPVDCKGAFGPEGSRCTSPPPQGSFQCLRPLCISSTSRITTPSCPFSGLSFSNLTLPCLPAEPPTTLHKIDSRFPSIQRIFSWRIACDSQERRGALPLPLPTTILLVTPPFGCFLCFLFVWGFFLCLFVFFGPFLSPPFLEKVPPVGHLGSRFFPPGQAVPGPDGPPQIRAELDLHIHPHASVCFPFPSSFPLLRMTITL